MADGRHIADRTIAISQWKIIQLWWHCVHDCTFGTRWQSRNQIWKFLKFKMADGRHFRNYFWPWLSNRLPDFSEILCEEGAFSQNFGSGIDTSLPQNVFFFVFLMQFVLRRVAAFASSLIHLFIDSISSTVYCIVFCNVMSAKSCQKHRIVRARLAEQLANTHDTLTKRTSQLDRARKQLRW